jgi:hypothetical protein
MCWTQKFSFSRDPVILDLKLQLAVIECFFWRGSVSDLNYPKSNLLWDTATVKVRVR